MKPGADAVRPLLVVVGGVGAGERLHRHVEVLDDEPAAGPQRAGHPAQGGGPLGDVGEHEAGVDEVEPARGRRVGGDVVAAAR